MHLDPIYADVYGTGTYPNTTFQKVFPIFVHPDLISTYVYGTHPNTMFQRLLPIFMHLDPISTGVYDSYFLMQHVEMFFQYLCIRICCPLMYMVPTLPNVPRGFSNISETGTATY